MHSVGHGGATSVRPPQRALKFVKGVPPVAAMRVQCKPRRPYGIESHWRSRPGSSSQPLRTLCERHKITPCGRRRANWLLFDRSDLDWAPLTAASVLFWRTDRGASACRAVVAGRAFCNVPGSTRVRQDRALRNKHRRCVRRVETRDDPSTQRPGRTELCGGPGPSRAVIAGGGTR